LQIVLAFQLRPADYVACLEPQRLLCITGLRPRVSAKRSTFCSWERRTL